MILIGSRALLCRRPDLLDRKPKDFDFIGYESDILNWMSKYSLDSYYYTEDKNKIISEMYSDSPCEFEIVKNETSSVLFIDLVIRDKETISTDFGMIPSFNLLFTLKASHRYLKNSPHFWKTAIDYHKMKLAGAKILPEYKEFFKLREKETYNYSHPKLNVTKNDFFNGDQINYIYDHDSIHEAMKHLEKPAYSFFKKEDVEVACDKNKFFELSEKTRLYSVLEESYVLALERSQIPFPDKVTPKKSFLIALSKVCSSITSGWWREYAYENIFNVLNMYDDSYVNKFKEGIKNGTVKSIK